MSYIYDIVLNFNSNYYEFYEWNKNDNIINIRKIPTFKVNEKTYFDIKFNDITVNENFLNLIQDETSLYIGTKNKYMCVITNGKEAIGIMFNKNGSIIKKSSLIIEEEEEVLELSYEIDTTIIDYKVNKVCYKVRFTIRSEEEKKKKIITSINHLFKINNYELIKYIYYDVFLKEENDINKIYKNLIKVIKKNDSICINKINSILQLINNH